MSVSVGKYLLWIKDYTATYPGGESKLYKRGTISHIVDIDKGQECAYFNTFDHAFIPAITGIVESYDSNIEALEASEDLMNPKIPPIATVPSWYAAAMAAQLVSSDTTAIGTHEAPTSKTSRYSENSSVCFTLRGEEYNYTTEDLYLDYDDGDNDTILHAIGLTSMPAQWNFCRKAYGYDPIEHYEDDFPCYEYDDYAAAERVVDAIKAECSRLNATWERERKIVRQRESEREKEEQAERYQKAMKKLRDSMAEESASTLISSGGSPIWTSRLHAASAVAKKFEYTPVYAIGTEVEFDTGRVSFIYKVQSHYMTCRDGWDAIYQELGVNPKRFIEEATGKLAVNHDSNIYGIQGYDMKSSDKLINTLLKRCADLRGTVRYVDARYGNHISSNTTSSTTSLDVSLDGLEVKKLEVYK